jgi:hypothetical protein
MDPQSIDQAYTELQNEFGEVAKSLKDLAQKLQKAADGGDNQARDWLFDLKTLALSIKSEQMQCQNLFSAVHGFIDNQHQSYSQQIPQYQQQYVQAGRGGLGGFLNSSFGRAIEYGAGFGLGDDLINSIF